MNIIEMIQSNVTENKTSLLIFLTEVGNIRLVIGLTIILAVILFIKKWYAAGLWFGGTILFCAAIGTKILKKVFDRTRPDMMQLIEKSTESFPSGHATATTIFYGLLGIALILLATKLWKKVIIGALSFVIIGFILISRIYLGVHFPTDVIAGFLYGMSSVLISIGFYQILAQPLQRLLKKIGLSDESETFTKQSLERQNL
ncbi:MAG TPA: phosphatase PAP2 family protein [Pseudogracilibacillus sp.]|nr:phosphatase PAP2 family protein [Pseudogracilibacillus sp.]